MKTSFKLVKHEDCVKGNKLQIIQTIILKLKKKKHHLKTSFNKTSFENSLSFLKIVYGLKLIDGCRFSTFEMK